MSTAVRGRSGAAKHACPGLFQRPADPATLLVRVDLYSLQGPEESAERRIPFNHKASRVTEDPHTQHIPLTVQHRWGHQS